MTTPKFTPSAETYEKLVDQLGEWLFQEAGRHFKNGFPEDATVTAMEDVREGRGFRLYDASDVFKKKIIHHQTKTNILHAVMCMTKNVKCL